MSWSREEAKKRGTRKTTAKKEMVARKKGIEAC
jgi:hypothetical protein